jgi:hypothetical protein
VLVDAAGEIAVGEVAGPDGVGEITGLDGTVIPGVVNGFVVCA